MTRQTALISIVPHRDRNGLFLVNWPAAAQDATPPATDPNKEIDQIINHPTRGTSQIV